MYNGQLKFSKLQPKLNKVEGQADNHDKGKQQTKYSSIALKIVMWSN